MGNAQLVRYAKEELAKRLLWKKYRTNPIAWLEDRFGEDRRSFMWSEHEGYENHEWDGDMDPIAQAWQALADNKWVGVESATGTGKTYSIARIVYWFLDCFENALVVTTTPKEAQLKLHLWKELNSAFHKFKKIRPDAVMHKLRLLVEGNGNEDEEDMSGWQAVGFVAGTGASEESATKAQGFHRGDMLIILEETPGISLPVITAFENTSTGGHNLILALGNPDSEVDNLHSFCQQESVKHIRVSAMDYPNVVLNKEIYKGAVTTGSINKRKQKYGEESPLYQSRVHGLSPAQSKDSLIKLDWINQCIDSDAYDKAEGKGALAIDVANSENGDAAAEAWGKGNTLLFMREFQCPNATHLAYNFLMSDEDLFKNGYQVLGTKKISTYGVSESYIGVDGVGVGVATVNAFLDKKKKVISLQGGQLKRVIPSDNEGKLLYEFSSLRAQMYYEASEDLRNKKVIIALKDKVILRQLIKELTIAKVEKKAKISVEAKEAIKQRLGGKSPNLADAFVYWNWIRKGYYKSKPKTLPFGT